MAKYILKVGEENKDKRLDVFLTQNLPNAPSRNSVQKLIELGCVSVNERAVKPRHKIDINDEICVEILDDSLVSKCAKPQDIPLDIFYEDDYLIVVNKPSGMMVHPAAGCYKDTLVNALLHYSAELSQVDEDMRPGIVHRLDKETSGVILIAKDNITHTKLAKQFKRHEIKKRYVALVQGEIEFDEGKVDLPIGQHPRYREKKAVVHGEASKDSVTYYRVIKRFKGVTLVALFPKTGRTHQLRVHMAHLHHPILGDDKYGKKISFPRLALHAQSIGFKHPASKCFVEFSSRPPREFLSKVGL